MEADKPGGGWQERSSEEVIADHLEKRRQGRLEEDIEENYGEGSLMLTPAGVFHGDEGARHEAEVRREALPGAEYDYEVVQMSGDVALLSWTARDGGAARAEGVETVEVRDGRIVLNTVHYSPA